MRVQGDGGVGIEVFVDGPEDGPPVLLMHGWPDTHSLWRNQVKALNDAGYRTIAPDLRGMGESDKPTDVAAYGLAHSVADMVAVLDACGVAGKAHVVAHDWGAAAGWGMALFTPERVQSYTSLSVGHPSAFRNAGIEQRMRSWYMLLFQFEGIAEQWLAENPFLLGGHPDAAEVQKRLAEPGALTASLGWYRANAHPRSLIGEPVQLPPVTVPVLGIWSTGDPALTEKQMTDSKNYVDGSWQYEKVEGAGHWMQLDAPDQVNGLVLDFLRSQSLSS
ncbi:MAG TPA: alpha/beta fold hydrolase [Mycobacteriales bacterium]|nr:alpha/beta fold hydrolase [Mycobacteriales bacterium]